MVVQRLVGKAGQREKKRFWGVSMARLGWRLTALVTLAVVTGLALHFGVSR